MARNAPAASASRNPHGPGCGLRRASSAVRVRRPARRCRRRQQRMHRSPLLVRQIGRIAPPTFKRRLPRPVLLGPHPLHLDKARTQNTAGRTFSNGVCRDKQLSGCYPYQDAGRTCTETGKFLARMADGPRTDAVATTAPARRRVIKAYDAARTTRRSASPELEHALVMASARLSGSNQIINRPNRKAY